MNGMDLCNIRKQTLRSGNLGNMLHEWICFFLCLVFDVSLSDQPCIFVDLIWLLSHISPEKKRALFFSFGVPVPQSAFFAHFSYCLLKSAVRGLGMFMHCPFKALLCFSGRLSHWSHWYLSAYFISRRWKGCSLKLGSDCRRKYILRRLGAAQKPKVFIVMSAVLFTAAVVSKGIVAKWCFIN